MEEFYSDYQGLQLFDILQKLLTPFLVNELVQIVHIQRWMSPLQTVRGRQIFDKLQKSGTTPFLNNGIIQINR